MNRRQIFAGILGAFGLARAQEGTGTTSNRNVIKAGDFYPIQWMGPSHTALANQCPVCGTMAKPIRGSKPMDQAIVRCRACSVAFFQDVER